jgi:hypothetical protein
MNRLALTTPGAFQTAIQIIASLELIGSWFFRSWFH